MTNPTLKPYIASIALNTGFYQPDTLPPNPALTPSQAATETNAEDLLQQMATYGNGLYQVYGSGQAINYEIFAPPIHNLKYQFQDIFVENENAVWWDDGSSTRLRRRRPARHRRGRQRIQSARSRTRTATA